MLLRCNISRPIIQTFILYIGIVLIPFTVGGTILDSLSNAQAFFSYNFSIWATVVVCLLWLLAHVVVAYWSIPWQTQPGQIVRIKRLGKNCTLVSVGLLLFFWVPHLLPRSSQDGLIEITPGSDPDPKMSCPFAPTDKNKLKIFVGSNVCSPAEGVDVLPVLEIAGESLIALKRRGNALFVSARVFSSDGRIIAKVEDNKLRVNERHKDFFYVEKKGLPHEFAVFDQTDTRVLLVRFVNSRAIHVEGIFATKGSMPVFVLERSIRIGRAGAPFSGNCAFEVREACFGFSEIPLL